jgi:hypothetical protein
MELLENQRRRVKSMKPKCKLVGENGNIFNLMGIAARTLKRAGLREEAEEMVSRITKSQSYDEALRIIMEYVDAE